MIRLLAAAVLVPLLLPGAASAATTGRVFRLTDSRIVEASSLVDFGSRMVTANDSGNPPDLFSVDSRTGRTVGVTHLDVPAVDIEALAPAGGSKVWVGDIGDNTQSRSSISLYLAPTEAHDLDVTPPTYRLVYPDGAHDAESLLADRGRVYVVTKSLDRRIGLPGGSAAEHRPDQPAGAGRGRPGVRHRRGDVPRPPARADPRLRPGRPLHVPGIPAPG